MYMIYGATLQAEFKSVLDALMTSARANTRITRPGMLKATPSSQQQTRPALLSHLFGADGRLLLITADLHT